MPEEETPMRHEKDLYPVYPVHIDLFRDRFNLKVTEMTALLGITSPQDWHKMRTNPGERVKNPVTCALLRAYNENPDWLSEMASFRRATKKLYIMFRKHEGYSSASAFFAITQVYDKSENVLRKWYKGASRPTLAALKMSQIINDLNGTTLQDFISDTRLSTIPQVNGKEVEVYRDKSGQRWYKIQDDDSVLSFDEIVKRCAVPGARRPRQETNEQKQDSKADNLPQGIGSSIDEAGECNTGAVARATKMASRLSWLERQRGSK